MREPSVCRLALGTAQFGLAYGVTNARGQVPPDEVARIVRRAYAAGIRLLDTAPAYGEAEAVLGRLEDLDHFRIATKTLPMPSLDDADIAAIDEGISHSRLRLGRPVLDVLLVHHGHALLGPGGDRLLKLVQDAKARGDAAAIGVSVYCPAELEAILARFTPDVVQLPFNVLDRRFQRAGLLARLTELGVEIHARSLFLQGTLLAGSASLPAHLRHLVPAIAPFEEFCRGHGISPLEACLGAGLAVPEITALVLGTTSAVELDELIATCGRALDVPAAGDELAVDDPRIVNPSLWPPARGPQ